MLVEDDENPDVYFDCNNGLYSSNQYTIQNKPVIYLFGETANYDAKLSPQSLTVRCDPQNDCVCNILFYCYLKGNDILSKVNNKPNKIPSKFACRTVQNFVIGDGFRDDFINRLETVSGLTVENGGGKISSGFEARYNFAKDYKFNICQENTYQNYYHTEKLLQAITSGIPVYYGADDDWIWKIFNKDAFIYCNGLNTLEVIKEIIRLNNNDDLYLEKYNRPVFTEDAFEIMEKELNEWDKFVRMVVRLFAKYE